MAYDLTYLQNQAGQLAGNRQAVNAAGKPQSQSGGGGGMADFVKAAAQFKNMRQNQKQVKPVGAAEGGQVQGPWQPDDSGYTPPGDGGGEMPQSMENIPDA